MVNYSTEMRVLSGKSVPDERECELYDAVCYLGESFQTERIKITSFSGTDNDIFNVYYEGNIVFNISTGITDTIKLYLSGEWEDKILEQYHLFK